MTSPTFRGLLWAVLVTLALVAGYLQIFTVFMLYDDEGYVLTSLNNFAQHGGLYDQVFSQYGPLFYLVFGGLARIGHFVWSHDIGRFVTLGHWLGTAGVCAWICFQLTRSHPTSAVAFAGTFAHLWQMSAEPMHPGGALALWIALGAGFSIKFLLSNRLLPFAATVALVAACCALVKINVGLFIAAAGFMWMVLNRSSKGGTWGRRFDWLLVTVAACGPTVLMLGLLDETWAATYAIVGGVAIGSIGIWTIRDSKPEISPSAILTAIATGLGAFAVTIIIIWICGTTPAQLLQGSLIGPLSHADIYHFPFNWRPGTLFGTLLSAVGCVLVFRLKPLATRPHQVIDALRILAATVVVLSSFSLPPRILGLVMTSFGITLWWFVTSEGETRTNFDRAKTWLALLLAWQFLHAYPVAGSQIGWGTFLWVPLAAAAIHSSCTRFAERSNLPSLWRRKIAPCAAVTLAGIIVIGQLNAGLTYYGFSAPLNLPGARHLSLPPKQGSAIRVIAHNAQLGSESLFSLPGAFSFNLWTGLDTPTKNNVTQWYSLLADSSQRKIETQIRLSQTPVIVQPKMVSDHLGEFIDPETTLYSYLNTNYESRLEIGSLALWRQQNDVRPVINIAEHYSHVAAESSDLPAQIISLRIEIPAHEKVVAVDLTVFNTDGTAPSPVQYWHQGNTAFESRPLTTDSPTENFAKFEPQYWPISASGLNEFRFYPTSKLPPVLLSRIWLRFRNAEGEMVAEARFANEPE